MLAQETKCKLELPKALGKFKKHKVLDSHSTALYG
jgi:hypothetical protein